jgi:hypothetical protein
MIEKKICMKGDLFHEEYSDGPAQNIDHFFYMVFAEREKV